MLYLTCSRGQNQGLMMNVVALGQQPLTPSGRNYQQAFLLVAASWGQASGTVTIHYTDGSTSSASVECS